MDLQPGHFHDSDPIESGCFSTARHYFLTHRIKAISVDRLLIIANRGNPKICPFRGS